MQAWKDFSRGKRKKPDVALFELSLESNILKLSKELTLGIWKPAPYETFLVKDPKLRRIHKATVRDRVLYQAVYRRLYQIFDKHFIHDSYASRSLKGTHRGVKRFEQLAHRVSGNGRRQTHVLKCDVRKFFDSIDHVILLKLLEKRMRCRKSLTLLTQIIGSFSTESHKGLPLGNVTSQVLANIYLNELDQFIKHTLKARWYIRYCDDFVIIDPSRENLVSNIQSIRSFLAENLKLSLHPNKVEIRKLSQGVDFLGYASLPHYRVLRTRTKRRMLSRLDEMKGEWERGEIELKKVQQTAQSYLGMLKHCKAEKIYDSITRIFYD